MNKKELLVINGAGPLCGEVSISGAKNSALPILAACVLGTEEIILDGVPALKDVEIMIEVLRHLGAKVDYLDKDTVKIDSSNINTCETPYELMDKMRASFVVMGPLLSRFKKAYTKAPGGCNIGARPIDFHLKGFEALGATSRVNDEEIAIETNGELIGNEVYLDFPSVGATQNIMMAAVLADGETTIENAAKEPEIVDLASFLSKMGAKIKGAGTSTIVIKGVEKLTGTRHTIIPDRIEAASYMIAAAMTKGNVTINNVIGSHIRPVIAKLIEMGANVEELEDEDVIKVSVDSKLKPTNIQTLPYPGFPTDAQAQFMALMTICDGESKIQETVFENRFMHVEQLNKMGAAIATSGNRATIVGVDKLHGADVKATDLRAGAALVIAALVAEGETRISDIYHIDRGYSDLVEKFTKLGANIKRVEI
ncbi:MULTISPECIES: UDP-N-acetylglucosamine 1-carboxyvinyltransferase [Anaerococcus]|uniref:UDP-N-acetylglucosamine 1-carboxyvinyltransferase n=1 Tax=Anaerococcus nagyae TaxID=1755241 RepID=A0A3E2TFT0_9FIRM|nr:MULTISPECIES: UDP-N-acetylglucosamine 1-carboxyvinyltransferase [Anaerococcus]MBP2070234.1 UDP-N-acetylglucosamine 1-carboxyvinyltransferase [Anaerococcus nagyae]MDU1829492.1 UDP-N-acetylglucosamine 1-carboxyvinyltransferase [Anaerococcus sp.]MDU1864046.1 UDP-N-acetylglucosamine 1-carboxyvinyltransferase [Anaerococcus sp.]MDU2353724.1 UDP-N-acetylglucosamine 1-carboxyvinyltransferase [Anaerococcus sp.]MDU2566142.1 UDP-N-acetylglucosamine 1-carboxyvinyltransferase [Anaerococcus sp.]